MGGPIGGTPNSPENHNIHPPIEILDRSSPLEGWMMDDGWTPRSQLNSTRRDLARVIVFCKIVFCLFVLSLFPLRCVDVILFTVADYSPLGIRNSVVLLL
jgi:hypothetical protein